MSKNSARLLATNLVLTIKSIILCLLRAAAHLSIVSLNYGKSYDLYCCTMMRYLRLPQLNALIVDRGGHEVPMRVVRDAQHLCGASLRHLQYILQLPRASVEYVHDAVLAHTVQPLAY